MCRTELTFQPAKGVVEVAVSSSPCKDSRTSCGEQRHNLRSKRLCRKAGVSLGDYAKHIVQEWTRPGMNTQQEREAFLVEVRHAVQERVQKFDRLEQVPDAEAILASLRERSLIGDAELFALRRRASQLLPFRRGPQWNATGVESAPTNSHGHSRCSTPEVPPWGEIGMGFGAQDELPLSSGGAAGEREFAELVCRPPPSPSAALPWRRPAVQSARRPRELLSSPRACGGLGVRRALPAAHRAPAVRASIADFLDPH